MEIQNHQIIDQLKSNVIAKLDELDSSKKHDLTLIDYILVMVVNQKTKFEMKHNLALFLGKIVDDFVNWLFEFLDQLKLNTNIISENAVSDKPDKADRKTELIKNNKDEVKNESKEMEIAEIKNVKPLKKVVQKKKLKSSVSTTNEKKDESNDNKEVKETFKHKKRTLIEDEDVSVSTKKRPVLENQVTKKAEIKTEVDYSNPEIIKSLIPVDDTSKENETKFLVTLDGVKDMFKDNDNLFLFDEDFDPELMKEDLSNLAPTQTKNDISIKENNNSNKLSERCKYWPACINGPQCEFFHPVTKCNTFPYCRFGDKCLYIHPTCKFDSFCSRKDCPYMHTAKRIPINAAPVTCKYFPNCMKPACDFFHPKICHFGSACKSFNCPYVHLQNQNAPHSSKFKWSSSKTNDASLSTISNKKEIEIK